MPQCPKCKAEVSADFKFCKQCGASVTANRDPEPPVQRAVEPSPPRVVRGEPPNSPGQPPRKRRGWTLPIVAVAIVVAIGAGLYAGPGTLRAYLPFGGAGKTSLKADQHLNQGLTFASMKDYDNAIVEFTRAIEVDPKYAAAYANRGVAYMQQKKLNKAMDDLRQAEGLNPKDKMVQYNLAALFSLEGQRDRGLDALDKALELGFSDYDALRKDPDLANLRHDPEFGKVLEKHKVFLQ